MAFYSGVSGDVTIGAQSMNCTNWSATESVAVVDVTNKSHGGYQTLNTDGKKSLNIQVDATWDDSNDNHSGEPPVVKGGTLITASLELGTSGEGITGSFVVADVTYTNPEPGDAKCSLSFTANSTGAYYLPGESTS